MWKKQLRALVLLALLSTSLLLTTRAAAQQCEAYNPPVREGTVTNTSLIEMSGLAFSREQDGVIWTHNDSGAEPLLFAINAAGETLGSWTVVGAQAVDWEDIALGPCADSSKQCLYIGELGNNLLSRTDLGVYRFPEPVVDLANPGQQGFTSTAEFFPLRYPDGDYDAESLMVHPTTGDVYIVTKNTMGISRLYHLPPLASPGQARDAVYLTEHLFGTLPFLHQATTGADFSPDGQRFVVRTYGRAHEFFLGDASAPSDVQTALNSEHLIISIPDEPQGEAIAYSLSGDAFWTISEGLEMPLFRFTCAAFSTGAGEDVEPNVVEEVFDAVVVSEPAPDAGSDVDAPALDDVSGDSAEDCACRAQRRSAGRPSWWAAASLALLFILAKLPDASASTGS